MKRTFLDASVLIAAARGKDDAARAFAIIDDPEREFVVSDFLRLEVVPRAAFHRREYELALYDAFFSNARIWVRDLATIVGTAFEEASRQGLEAFDALHVSAAALGGAEELVTLEKLSRSIHRATAVRVVHLDAAI